MKTYKGDKRFNKTYSNISASYHNKLYRNIRSVKAKILAGEGIGSLSKSFNVPEDVVKKFLDTNAYKLF